MSKIRIYIEPEKVVDSLRIDDRQTLHKIKDVLRLKSSDDVYVFDGQGKEYSYRIADTAKNSFMLKKKSLVVDQPLPKQRVSLGFPILREERVDFILQKATELGVWQLIPFICERSIQQSPSKNKLLRWEKIIIEAARQSQRVWLPQLSGVVSFDEILSSNINTKVAGFIDENTLEIASLKKAEDILFVVGPVGDFTDSEYDSLKKNGFKGLQLSNNILRTETAAAFGVGLIKYFLEFGK